MESITHTHTLCPALCRSWSYITVSSFSSIRACWVYFVWATHFDPASRFDSWSNELMLMQSHTQYATHIQHGHIMAIWGPAEKNCTQLTRTDLKVRSRPASLNFISWRTKQFDFYSANFWFVPLTPCGSWFKSNAYRPDPHRPHVPRLGLHISHAVASVPLVQH